MGWIPPSSTLIMPSLAAETPFRAGAAEVQPRLAMHGVAHDPKRDVALSRELWPNVGDEA